MSAAENRAYVAYCTGGSTPEFHCDTALVFPAGLCRYDRNTGERKEIDIRNDATRLVPNPVVDRLYTGSEVNRVTTVLDPATEQFVNAPLCLGAELAVREASIT